MKERLIPVVLLMIAAAPVYGQKEKAEKLPSFPVALNPDDVREFAPLSVKANDLELTGVAISGIPMTCEPGITGMMLIGDGTFRFSPKDGEVIEGQFRGAMLRFNPKDQPTLLPLEKNPPVIDRAVHEMSSTLLPRTMRRCWHAGQDALIPDEGTLAVVVFSRKYGELLISTGPGGATVFNFTTRERLYDSKSR